MGEKMFAEEIFILDRKLKLNSLKLKKKRWKNDDILNNKTVESCMI